VRERRWGALGRATDIAGDVAAAVRRAQRGREPRVLLYDAAGYARRLPPDSEAHDEVLAAAERLVELVELGEREARRNGRGEEPGDGR
jgi:hypothetical protein